MSELPLLSLLIWIPALTALVLAAVPGFTEQFVKVGALAASLVVFALSLVLLLSFDASAPGLAFVEDHAWIDSFHVRYALGIDGIALSMMVLTALIQPMAIVASWNAIHDRASGFFIALLVLEAGMMGVFAASDLFLFYTFWEVMLIPMALLIGIWGGPRRVYASIKFVLYTMAGSLLMFIAILYGYWAVQTATGTGSFDIATWAQVLPTHVSPFVQIWLFAAFGVSFAIKVPLFPFHTWLPDAHVEAPTAGSVILAGVLLKMGTYGFLRFAIPFFPAGALALTPLILALSAIGIVYGSLMSMTQTDIKKLIAYSSVAHLGFVMLGLFSGSLIAAQGAVMQMVNHGISTGALFLLVGVIYERTHIRGTKDFGGLARVMPVYATLFLIVTLSSIGLPGTNGFVGEFLILLGTFQRYPIAAFVGAIGVVLGAVYMLTLYRNVFYGPGRASQKDLKDVTPVELMVLVPLVVLIFVLGLQPNLMLSVTEAPVARVVQALVPGEDLHVTAGALPPSAAPADAHATEGHAAEGADAHTAEGAEAHAAEGGEAPAAPAAEGAATHGAPAQEVTP
jgi:NADH-quinone oxidoreductase subunit M